MILEGLRVLEFTHAVMGPCAGMMLADNGAEVILVEPPNGSSTRRLKGFGTGYFSFYNRNKKSLAIDIKSDEGKQVIYDLVKTADIVVENFGPGTMDRLGFGYEKLKELQPSIIYCSLKGFLSGPYEKRHAMDEVVQMMGGLAYMTGRSGDPLRAGTSAIDITGGMFGYIGILQALYKKQITGEGTFIKASLYETCAFLVGQHMAYQSQMETPIPPMPERVSAWSVYRVFDTKDDDKIFIGIISEKHWIRFCDAFGWEDYKTDPRLETNNQRIDAKDWFTADLESRIKAFTKSEIMEKCDEHNIPFAPITQPKDLYDDPQLNEGNSLMPIKMRDGSMAKLPKVPLEFNGTRIEKRNDPPPIGNANEALLQEVGYDQGGIAELKNKSIIT